MKHEREDYSRIQDSGGLIPEDEPVFLLRAQDVVNTENIGGWRRYAAVS